MRRSTSLSRSPNATRWSSGACATTGPASHPPLGRACSNRSGQPMDRLVSVSHCARRSSRRTGACSRSTTGWPPALRSGSRCRVPVDQTSVLVIEDHRAQQAFLAAAFEARGHRVFIAATGAAGLDLMDSEAPDLVILDLGLPDVDGI